MVYTMMRDSSIIDKKQLLQVKKKSTDNPIGKQTKTFHKRGKPGDQ